MTPTKAGFKPATCSFSDSVNQFYYHLISLLKYHVYNYTYSYINQEDDGKIKYLEFLKTLDTINFFTPKFPGKAT